MAVVIVDRHWMVAHASPRFTELLRWSPELISGRSLVDLVHPDDRSGWEAALGDLDLLDFAACDCRVRTSAGGWLCLAATMTQHQGFITVLCEIRPRD